MSQVLIGDITFVQQISKIEIQEDGVNPLVKKVFTVLLIMMEYGTTFMLLSLTKREEQPSS